MVLAISVMLALFQLLAQAQERREEHPMKYPTSYRTTQIDGLSIFYREAGPKDAPTLLLLHGLPSSSRMFEPLFTRLSDRWISCSAGCALPNKSPSSRTQRSCHCGNYNGDQRCASHMQGDHCAVAWGY
jgi:hypothetical protein